MCGLKRKRPLESEDDDSDGITSESDLQLAAASDLDNSDGISDSNNSHLPSTSNTQLNNSESDDSDLEDGNEQVNNESKIPGALQNHPPTIQHEHFISDISFHPTADLLALADGNGDVYLYDYNIEANVLKQTLEAHTDFCRSLEFHQNGESLFSASKDHSIMVHNVNTMKLQTFYDEAHNAPINCLHVFDENLFASGDENGTIAVWDLRLKNAIYTLKQNNDYISGMITNEPKKYLLWTSGDGYLNSLDLNQRKPYVQSEQYDEEFTCLGLFKDDSKVLVCTHTGNYYLFTWNEFGYHSDKYFTARKTAINHLVPITENIVVAAYEDGNLRATNLFPHRPLGVVGQHRFSVERLDISNNGTFVASCSHDNCVKFWNIEYFEQMNVGRKHKQTQKGAETKCNLPSSNVETRADFFKDLC